MTGILIFLSLVFLLAYAILILYFRSGWQATPEIKLQKDYTPVTSVSVIIPARNEEKNIGRLLRHISAQIYPIHLTEIIVVDDHSTDQTAQIVSTYPRVKLISLQDFTQGQMLNAYKKKAIETAIAQSTGELIITTDADCSMHEFWLLSIVHYYEQTHARLIASPVSFFNHPHWFRIFQSIDFLTMQGVTGALARFKSGTMCNGANLAYTREAFDAVNGFDGIDDIASGDDMLLMYKIDKRFPGRTAYLKCKDAIVQTDAMNSVRSFFAQRIRWASKASKFKDKRLVFILAFVFFFNLFLAILAVGSLVNFSLFHLFIVLVLLKASIEISLLVPVCKFFDKQHELIYFYILQLLHIPYIILSAVLSQIGTYQWKDRKVK